MKVRVNGYRGIQYIEVINSLGLKATFSSLGATLLSVYLNDVSMTLSPKTNRDSINPNVYYGKTIGLIAGRIKNGQVVINDKTYQFDLNEGENTLHGGITGLSNQHFATQRFKKDDCFIIMFSTEKHKKKGHLPGTINTFIVYTIYDKENKIRVDFRSRSDEDTLVSLTNHSYFCLGDPNIDNLSLKLKSDRFVKVNEEDLVPESIEDILPCLDFNNEKKLIEDIDDPYLVNSKANGIDHYYIFSKDRKLYLRNDNYKLIINTDFPGVVIYTDNYEDGVIMGSTEEIRRRGVAIEPEDNPLDRKILKKMEDYSRFIEYEFMKN